MPTRDIVGTAWTAERQTVYDAWASLCDWLQKGVDKRRPQLGQVGVMHRVVDAVRALEAIGRVPAGSGDLVEQLWQDTIANTEDDLGTVSRADYVARARALFQVPVP